MPTDKRLNGVIEQAKLARRRAYSPYSGVKIGAAVLTSAGEVFSGCNIENASYGLSCCAERTAIFKAVSDGQTGIIAIAIVGKSEEFTAPCGMCRQVMVEFNPRMKVVRRGLDGFASETTARKLLPHRFTFKESSRR